MGILPAPLEAPLLGLRLHGRSAKWLWLYGLGMLGSVVYFAQRYPLHGHAPLFKVETEKPA
jgi:hypothetical protein